MLYVVHALFSRWFLFLLIYSWISTPGPPRDPALMRLRGAPRPCLWRHRAPMPRPPSPAATASSPPLDPATSGVVKTMKKKTPRTEQPSTRNSIMSPDEPPNIYRHQHQSRSSQTAADFSGTQTSPKTQKGEQGKRSGRPKPRAPTTSTTQVSSLGA